MSDKSKLGFNINPKSYDELNSTDNLITSGSDSGWLGKKLQGDDNNDLDLSKINPIFDKELYEKYRPGVNTNDGSVNQDIWGYKCFNSPVSFRNGIYGDTYSIHSIDTYEGDQLNNTKKNGIIIQPYNKQAGSLNNIDSTFRICNEKRSEQKDDKDLIYIDTRETHIQHSYTGKENQHNIEDVNLYEILKNTYIDGANTENISYTQSNVFPGSSEYSISFIQNTFDHCTIYSSNSTHRENAVTYNGINTFSNKKIDKQIGPFPYITTYNYKDFVNITSSIYYTNNIGTDEEPKHNYNISRITIGTECGNDPVIEKEITANNNCIRMYSADGTHGNSDYTNDNISSIIITPDYISISAKNSANQSTDNPYIKIDGTDNSITLHAGKLNLPDTIETTAKFAAKASALSKEINSANYIYATDNSILPSNDGVISLGDLKTKYNTIYTNKLIATDESTIANLIIKNNLTYSDFSNHVVKYKLKNTSQPGINHAVTQSYKSNYANNELSILYTESFNIGTDRRRNIYKEYGLSYGICIYGDDDRNGMSDIVIGSQNISILKPVRPLYAVHTEIVTSNVILKRNHSSFKIGTINAIGDGAPLKSIIITPTCGDVYDIYVFTTNARFPYTCTNLTGLTRDKNGLILPGTIMLPRLRKTAEDPYYYTCVVVENTVDLDVALQKDEVVFSGFNASQPIAEYGYYCVVLEHLDYLAYEVLETVFKKKDEVYFKCKVKVVDRHAAEKFSAIV